MISTIYLENNVFDEALNRIRWIFDEFPDVLVCMSGGKDSTVLYNLALMVAKEKNRLPLKVFWIDQEAEWQSTVDYMTEIMESPDVKPYWYQVPFNFTNSLSATRNFLKVWDPEQKDLWVHKQHPLAITENPSKYDRFHPLSEDLHEYCTDADRCAVLVGIKCCESMHRRVMILNGKARYKGETWAKTPYGKTQTFWPIYDFTNDDIWTAIANNGWKYNRVYDWFYQKGVSKANMRVSALIHETAWHEIEFLQEFEPKTYNNFVRRISGVSTFNHCFEQGIMPKELPFAFSDWKEYRDYLLEHITQEEYRDLFRRRWKNQNDEEFYKLHVREIIINDIDGTINANFCSNRSVQKKASDKVYRRRDAEDFEKWVNKND